MICKDHTFFTRFQCFYKMSITKIKLTAFCSSPSEDTLGSVSEYTRLNYHNRYTQHVCKYQYTIESANIKKIITMHLVHVWIFLHFLTIY